MSERLVIARIAHRGDGVADSLHGPLYVPYTLPGETVEVDAFPGHPDRRQLLRVDVASPDRVEPFCPHFGVCGGCAIQHWVAGRYRAWKRDLVVTALRQVGLETSVDDLIDAHGEGRRRATFHGRRGQRDTLQVGFATLRAHRLVAIDRCPVLAPSLDGAIQTAWAIAEALEPLRKPLDIQVTASEAGLDVDLRGSGPLVSAQIGALGELAESRRLARLTRHGEVVAQRTRPTVTMGRASVMLPPGSFLQATAEGEAVLARLVQEHAANSRTIADLFCGLGPFALRLAERMRVSAFDLDGAAVAALSQAAHSTAGLKPIEALTRDLFRRPLVAAELHRFDAVLFDPPRQGAEAQARELARSAVPVVIAVSCNPATFARDARILADGGYRPSQVTPIDQFRHSAHVEIVARFVKNRR